MKVAAVQTKPFALDTDKNIIAHCNFIRKAADHSVNLIVFPEMSLTGYERESARQLSFSADDERLQELKHLATNLNIAIVASAPIAVNDQLYIGAFLLRPYKPHLIYLKENLHSGEESFFSPGKNNFTHYDLNGDRVSLSICSDIANPNHVALAASKGTTLYAASIFYTPTGINEGYRQLKTAAQKHSMNVLMSNFGGRSYVYESAGRSAYWDKSGNLIATLPENTEGLLIIETETNEYSVFDSI